MWNVSKTVSVNWQCLLERQKKSFRYQRWHSGASMKHLIKLITHGTLRPHRLWFHIYAYVLNWMQFIKVTYWIRTKFLNQFRSKFLSSKLKFYDVHCLEFHLNFLGCMQFDWNKLILTNTFKVIHFTFTEVINNVHMKSILIPLWFRSSILQSTCILRWERNKMTAKWISQIYRGRYIDGIRNANHFPSRKFQFYNHTPCHGISLSWF